MNLETMTDLAIAKVLGPSQVDRAVDVNAAVVEAFINEAYHKVERAALWKFSEATVDYTLAAGATTSVPPVDMAIPLMVFNHETGLELEFYDERQKFLHASDFKGAVRRYSLWAGTFHYDPEPTTATDLTLRYYQSWADLALPADEPLFPDTWHDILSDYAAAKLSLRLQPVAGRYLPSSAAEPYELAWRSGLAAMLDSDLVLPTFDIVHSEHLLTQVAHGEGLHW